MCFKALFISLISIFLYSLYIKMEDEDLNAKQTFLRENILEKGYDAEDFMKLLQNKKGESGLDLISWTMNELKEAVNEFVQDKSPEISPIEEEEKIDNKTVENEKDNENENEEQNENNAAQSEEVDNLDKFQQEYPEKSSQKEEYAKTTVNEFTGFTDKEGIVVKVSSPEKKRGWNF